MGLSRTFKAGLLTLGRGLATCAWIAAFACLSRILSKHDYASYRQTVLAYRLALPVMMLGLPRALYYFIPLHRERARGLLLENVLLLAGMGMLFSVLLLVGGNRALARIFNNPELERTLLVFAPYTLFAMPAMALDACLIARDQVKKVPVYNVLSRLALVGAVITGALIWGTPSAALAASVVAAVVVLLGAMKLMLGATRNTGAQVRFASMLDQLKFSVPLGLAGMLSTISLSLDRFIVAALVEPEDFAIYANGAIEIPVLGMISGAAMSVLIPEFAAFLRDGKKDELLTVWQNSIVKIAMLVFPLTLFFWVMAEEAVVALFSSEYAESTVVFRIYLLVLPLKITTWGGIYMAAGRGKLVLLRSLAALLLKIPIIWVAVQLFGYQAAAWGTVTIMYAWGLPYNMRFLSKTVEEPWSRLLPYKRLGKICLSVALAGLVLFLRPLVVPVLSERLVEPVGKIVSLAVLAGLYVTVLLVVLRLVGMLRLRRVLRQRGRELLGMLRGGDED